MQKEGKLKNTAGENGSGTACLVNYAVVIVLLKRFLHIFIINNCSLAQISTLAYSYE
jgi:hypothetical protein